jgi:ketosteroid isomerase-like protein
VTDLVGAIATGRLEDLLTLIHPDAVWQPVTRPGLSVYAGRTGLAEFAQSIADTYQPFHTEIESITADGPSQVTVTTRIIRETPDGDRPEPPITSVCTLRDGLVISMESSYPPQS